MIPLPHQETPFVNTEGFLVLPWRRVWDDLRNRLGGAQDIRIQATDNTHLTFYYRGSDGIVRSGSVTLS